MNAKAPIWDFYPLFLFFQNEGVFFQLDELDKLDRFIQEWIELNYSLTKTQKTF